MFLAEKTVKNYVSSLLAKLGLERRTQAAVLATRLLGRGCRRPDPRPRQDPHARARPAAAVWRAPPAAREAVSRAAGPSSDLGAAGLGRADLEVPAEAVGPFPQVDQPAAGGGRVGADPVVGDRQRHPAAGDAHRTCTAVACAWRTTLDSASRSTASRSGRMSSGTALSTGPVESSAGRNRALGGALDRLPDLGAQRGASSAYAARRSSGGCRGWWRRGRRRPR